MGPVADDASALLMDEADIEEVTSMTTHSPDPTAKVTAPLQHQEQRIGDVVAARQQGPADGSTAAPKVETAALPDTDASRSLPEPEGMDTLSGPILPAGKRTHDRILTQATQQEGSGGDEPPPKAPGIRRPTFKPRPNITFDSRQAGKPHPRDTPWKTCRINFALEETMHSCTSQADHRSASGAAAPDTYGASAEYHAAGSAGNDETQCMRSYANVTGSGGNEDTDEHYMDQADAEATAKGGGYWVKTMGEQQTEASGERGENDDGAAVPAASIKPLMKRRRTLRRRAFSRLPQRPVQADELRNAPTLNLRCYDPVKLPAYHAEVSVSMSDSEVFYV
ncbi:hypothetical protein HPB50_028419 [Hyalomma asiaticum]|nr:hypothetical protein HPB50_028419 [Hyalomma asiaticum]